MSKRKDAEMKEREYVSLYRKYRPETFEDVIDQEHVVEILRRAVRDDTLAHAYLFSGSRGTGKTSVARILAREIGTSENDTYEIDAASNRGIDEARALREAVRALPFESKYKVYIIDEAHMLTKDAFNALLKTLEEPPEHVIFILATTELHKFPDTIISRCEVHHFKKPSRKTLAQMVERVSKEEKKKLETGVSELIAHLGDGSFRDTLGVLQKIFTSAEGDHISLVETERITGAPKTEILHQLLTGIHESDTEASLGAIHTASKNDFDMKLFAELLVERMRAILLIRFAPELQSDLKEEYGVEEYAFLEKIAKSPGSKINSKSLARLLDALPQLGYSGVQELPLELAVLDLVVENDR
jgi:DNA polymerase-3 subunit gamma/tau